MRSNFVEQLNDFLPYGVILVSENHEIIYQNQKSKGLLNLKKTGNPDEGKLFDNLSKFPDLYLFVEDSFIHKKNFSREFYLSEESVVQVDGIFLSEKAILNDGKDLNGSLVLCIYPVSHFKRSEKNQRQFVANVSHELKTPLTSILGYLETLLDDESIEPEVQNKFLGIIQRQSQRLATIVSDLLTLSQLDREEVQEKSELSGNSLLDIIKNSIGSLAFKADSKNVKILFKSTTDFILPLDPGLMEQALVNLIDNAIKFTPDGGVVEIKVKKEFGHIELNVIDEGPGIPEKYHTRIFERFFSVDKGRSRKLGGSGLGLSIVKHIIYNHKGDVFVKNRTSRTGSVFTIHLPTK